MIQEEQDIGKFVPIATKTNHHIEQLRHVYHVQTCTMHRLQDLGNARLAAVACRAVQGSLGKGRGEI